MTYKIYISELTLSAQNPQRLNSEHASDKKLDSISILKVLTTRKITGNYVRIFTCVSLRKNQNYACIRVGCLYHTFLGAALLWTLRKRWMLYTSDCFFKSLFVWLMKTWQVLNDESNVEILVQNLKALNRKIPLS